MITHIYDLFHWFRVVNLLAGKCFNWKLSCAKGHWGETRKWTLINLLLSWTFGSGPKACDLSRTLTSMRTSSFQDVSFDKALHSCWSPSLWHNNSNPTGEHLTALERVLAECAKIKGSVSLLRTCAVLFSRRQVIELRVFLWHRCTDTCYWRRDYNICQNWYMLIHFFFLSNALFVVLISSKA